MAGYKYRGELFASDGSVPLPRGRIFEKFITIAIFRESFNALLSKMILEEEGIECSISDEYTYSSSNLFSCTKAGYRLRVRESEAAKAVRCLLREPVRE